MTFYKKLAASAAALILVLSLGACSQPSAPETTSQSASQPASETSSTPEVPSSIPDPSGLPPISLPESLPKGDYAFEPYDGSLVQVGSEDFTLENQKVSATVLTVPAGMRNYVEVYADGVGVGMCELVEESEGYMENGMGMLSGSDQWVAEEHSLKAGDKFDITLDKAGFYRIYFLDTEMKMTSFFFRVA